MAKTRVYISFDYDHDSDLKNFLVGQSKNDDSPFDIADWSIKEAVTVSDWQDTARKRIRAVDVVAVICGQHTDTATGVSAEVSIAQNEGIPCFLLAGRKTGSNKKPKAAKTTDKLYEYLGPWPNLEEAHQRRTLSQDPSQPERAARFEQYKLAVELADRSSARRGTANGFVFHSHLGAIGCFRVLRTHHTHLPLGSR